MKKSFIFALFGTTCALVVGAALTSTSSFIKLSGTGNQTEWVHYKQKDATPTEKGIREYWVQCGGAYQFTEPTGASIREATQYDTSGFETNDDRWLTYVSGSVFYNMAASDWDYREVGTALDGYTAFNEVDKTTYGAKLNAVYTKAGSPSLMVEQLTVTKILTTAAEFLTLNVNVATNPRTSFTYKTIVEEKEVEKTAYEISGYYVLGNDISYTVSNVGWTDECHANRFIGTLDGRGHKMIQSYNWGAAGLFGARNSNKFTIKNIIFDKIHFGSYGIFGYMVDGLTLDNVTIVAWQAGTNPTATSLFANQANSIVCKNCCFDCREEGKPIINDARSPKFTDTNVPLTYHNSFRLFNKLDNTAYTENYSFAGVKYVCNTYSEAKAEEPTYLHGGHGAGYYCAICSKFFNDAHHTNEMTISEDPLPSKKVEGVQLFYNLANKTIDNSEVPDLDTKQLVGGDCQELSFVGVKAGDVIRTFLPGTPKASEYEMVVVTDVIAAEDDFATKLNASAKDLVGYFVFTKDLGTVNTVNGGSNTTQTAVQVTVDGRNHSINLMVIKSSAGGMFGSCGSGKAYDVVFKNLIIKKSALSDYGMFGYSPANNADQSLLIENCDITAGGSKGNRYGVLCTLSNARIALKNVTIDFTQNDFSGGEEVKSGSYVFQQGARGTYENVKIIIILAHDTYKNNYTEGSKTYTDVIKPDAIIGDKASEERDTKSLVPKIDGVTFLEARTE